MNKKEKEDWKIIKNKIYLIILDLFEKNINKRIFPSDIARCLKKELKNTKYNDYELYRTRTYIQGTIIHNLKEHFKEKFNDNNLLLISGNGIEEYESGKKISGYMLTDDTTKMKKYIDGYTNKYENIYITSMSKYKDILKKIKDIEKKESSVKNEN